jgi:hypothetical protein
MDAIMMDAAANVFDTFYDVADKSCLMFGFFFL